MFATILGVGYALVSTIPFLFVGENWGMMWMIIQSPMAEIIQPHMYFIYGYPVTFYIAVTVLNGFLLGCVVWIVAWLVQRFTGSSRIEE